MSERVKQSFEANRAGRLIEEQQQSLRNLLRRETMESWVQWSALPTFVGMMVIYFIVIPPLGNQLGPLILVVIVLALVVVVIAVRVIKYLLRGLITRALNNPRTEAWLRRHLASYDREYSLIEQGDVEILTGRMTKESDGEHTHMLFDGQPLDSVFSAAIGNLFITLDRDYILYRLKGSLWLVNMEIIEPVSSEMTEQDERGSG